MIFIAQPSIFKQQSQFSSNFFFDNIDFCTCACIYSRTHHTQPTTIQLQPTLLGILSPVPRGAMCTAGMAGVGSGLHHCIGCHCTCPAAALSSNACGKPC